MRCWLLLALLSAVPMYGAGYRTRVYPNSRINILAIAEDPQHYLWLATPDGLYRFDGSHYQHIPAYPFESARYLATASDGALWIGGDAGLVRYREGKFSVIIREEVRGMAPYESGVVATFASITRLFRSDGASREIPYLGPTLSSDKTGSVIGLSAGAPSEILVQTLRPGSQKPEVVSRLAANVLGPWGQAIRDSDGHIWVGDTRQAFRLGSPQEMKRTRIRRQLPTDSTVSQALVGGRTDEIYFLGNPIRRTLDETDLPLHLPPKAFVQTAAEDYQGRVWFAVNGIGLCQVLREERFASWTGAFGDSTPAQVAKESTGTLLMAVHDGRLRRLNAVTNTWDELPANPTGDYFNVFPLSDGTILASTKNEVVHLNHQGAVLSKVDLPVLALPNKQGRDARHNPREMFQDRTGTLWLASKQQLYRLHRNGVTFTAEPALLPNQSSVESYPSDLEQDASGRLWIGYADGIAWLDDNGHWQSLKTNRPVVNVRSLSPPAPNGDDIWVAYRAAGRFSRLHRQGDVWLVQDFPAQTGYGPESTYFIKRSSNGWIWRGTSDGVFVSDGTYTLPGDWLHLGPDAGLGIKELDQYGFREDPDRTIWLSGGRGVTQVLPDPLWFHDPPGNMRISRVQADGQSTLDPGEGFAAPFGTRVLHFDVGLRGARMPRALEVVYRVPGLFNDWRPVSDAAVELRDLPTGAYVLELARPGTTPVASLVQRFRVGPPPAEFPWKPVAASAAFAAALLGLLRISPWYPWIHYRASRWRHRALRTRTTPGDRSPADLSGTTLGGRYQLMSILSRGGFSTVYRARDMQDASREVAVKVLEHRTGASSWVKSRFAHEVAALRQLNHPGIVPILDSFVAEEGWPCVVMPRLSSPTLRQAMKAGPIARVRVAKLLRNLGETLEEVHRRGVVHRDVKPENILLVDRAGTEQPILIDFGTAGWLGVGEDLASTQVLMGSAHYMAPEQLTNHYAQSSDTYSLGVIALELLTGKRPSEFSQSPDSPGFSEELAAAIFPILGRPSSRLVQMLASALVANPRSRPESIATWASQLAAALES